MVQHSRLWCQRSRIRSHWNHLIQIMTYAYGWPSEDWRSIIACSCFALCLLLMSSRTCFVDTDCWLLAVDSNKIKFENHCLSPPAEIKSTRLCHITYVADLLGHDHTLKSHLPNFEILSYIAVPYMKLSDADLGVDFLFIFNFGYYYKKSTRWTNLFSYYFDVWICMPTLN